MNRENTCGRNTILIYSAGKDASGRRFKKEVEGVFPDTLIDVYRTPERLRKTLIENMGTYQIVVLLCATREELCFFSLMRDLISESRLILIIPDHQAETIHRAHRLYPRFLSYTDGNFTDVAAVIQRLASLDFHARTANRDQKTTAW